jgi:mRNA interferase HicA
MKRSELIRKLTDLGCIMIRHGGKHDWYQNPITGMYQPIPRHSDINEHLAKQILKKLKP